MKRFISVMMLCLLFSGAASDGAAAQQIRPVGGTALDDGIYAWRGADVEQPSFYAGDVLRLVPAGTAAVMKLCGLQSSSSWGDFIVSAGFSGAAVLAGGYGLKYAIKRMRPDFSESTSMPSGHAITAFATATVLQKEYGTRYPWVGFGGYALATLTAFERIAFCKHWATDVIAGSAIGVLCTELGYLLGGLIFRKDRLGRRSTYDGVEITPAGLPYEIGFYYAGSVIFGFPSAGGLLQDGRRDCLGTMGLEGRFPVRKSSSGVIARLGVGGYFQQMTSKTSDQSFYDAGVGWYYSFGFIERLSLSPHILAGPQFVSSNAGGGSLSNFTLLTQVGADIALRLGPSCARSRRSASGRTAFSNYSLRFTADFHAALNRYTALMLGGGASFCF